MVLVINGIDINDAAGFSVSEVGDFNGDGIDDFIIGASSAGAGFSFIGESYLIFGDNGGLGASLDLSSLNGSNGVVINGIDPFDFAGFNVSGAGDINGDGLDDVIIGAPQPFLGGPPGSMPTTSGESYVVFGTAAPTGASFNLASLNGSNGFGN